MNLTVVDFENRFWNSRILGNPDSYHAIVWKMFKGESERPFIFRCEQTQEKTSLIILSTVEPNINAIPCSCIRTKQISEKSFPKGRYRFKVAINPTIRGSRDRKIRRKPNQDVAPWLQNALKSSAKIVNITSINNDIQYSLRTGEPISHYKSDIEGVMDILDPSGFLDIISKGIGRAKAYGFGLLLPIIIKRD